MTPLLLPTSSGILLALLVVAAVFGWETAAVDQPAVAPPPPPAPPTQGPAPVGSGGSFGSGADRPWDAARVRSIAEQWFRPLLEVESWLAIAYLVVGMLAAIGFFTAILTFGAAAFGLTFIGVGVFLYGAFFRMVDAFAHAERAMAGWVGAEIAPRPIAPIRGVGIRSIADGERWRQTAYFGMNIVVAPLLASIGLVLGPLPAVPWPLALPVWILALGAVPRIAKFIARLKAQIAAWFLGPDRLAEAEERVSTLSSQRQEILDAVAAERRRIERNLHDGVQQQLVAIGLDIGMADAHLDTDPVRTHELLVLARDKIQASIGELRSLGRGLHPAILDDRGLDAALSALAAGASIPITVRVDPQLELPTDVQATVYFIANEAIANVLKHARARTAAIDVVKVGANVRVTVHDDGRGGADPASGTGLPGIRARVHGVDGVLSVSSPPGGPTTLVAEIPRHARTD